MNKTTSLTTIELSELVSKAQRAIKLGRGVAQMSQEELWQLAETIDQILYLLPVTKYTARIGSTLISLQAAALRKLPAEIW